MKGTFKLLFIATIILSLVLGSTCMAFAADEQKVQVSQKWTNVFVDGNKISLRYSTDGESSGFLPIIIDGTIYAPVREIGEAFGKEVTWDDATKSVIIGKMPKKLDENSGTTREVPGACGTGVWSDRELFYKSIQLYVDGEKITPKDANGKVVEPFIYQDRFDIPPSAKTMLPVRAIADALNKPIEWDQFSRTVYIGDKPEIVEDELDLKIKELGKDNSSYSDIYAHDKVATRQFVTELEILKNDLNNEHFARFITQGHVIKGGFHMGGQGYVTVSTRKEKASFTLNNNPDNPKGFEDTFDLTIERVNNMASSEDATWIALEQLFGTEDATTVWYGMGVAMDNAKAGTFAPAQGTIKGWKYVVDLGRPTGYNFYFKKI